MAINIMSLLAILILIGFGFLAIFLTETAIGLLIYIIIIPFINKYWYVKLHKFYISTQWLYLNIML